jgi:hypothetical protein
VHDIVALEGLGIPSVMVASAEFVEAAQTQGHALGAEPRRVFVEHPIQDRTDDEMRAIADRVVDDLLRAVVDT